MVSVNVGVAIARTLKGPDEMLFLALFIEATLSYFACNQSLHQDSKKSSRVPSEIIGFWSTRNLDQ